MLTRPQTSTHCRFFRAIIAYSAMTWMRCRWRVTVWRKTRDWRHHAVVPLSTSNCDVGVDRALTAWLRFISVLIYCLYLSGAFAKLRESTISFVTCVCPSVRIEKLGSHLTDFHEMWYLSIFRKTVAKIQVSLKSGKNNGYITWRPLDFFLSYFTQFS